MGLSGVSGPFRGAYNILQFSTPSIGVGSLVGGVQHNMGTWNVPAGMDIEIVDAQIFCTQAGTAGRVNILAGGASILGGQTTFAPDVQNGIAIVAGETVGTGYSVTATLSTNVFGTTATSQANSVTPSGPGNIVNRGKTYGAYIMGGATLSATCSASANTGPVTITLLWIPKGHPSALRSGTE